MNYIARLREAVIAEVDIAGFVLDDRLADLYTLLAADRGTLVDKASVHNAWAVWRNSTALDHPDLIPFADLPSWRAALDEPFVRAIRRAVVRAEATGRGFTVASPTPTRRESDVPTCMCVAWPTAHPYVGDVCEPGKLHLAPRRCRCVAGPEDHQWDPATCPPVRDRPAPDPEDPQYTIDKLRGALTLAHKSRDLWQLRAKLSGWKPVAGVVELCSECDEPCAYGQVCALGVPRRTRVPRQGQ